jgi:predicted permease
MMGLIGDVRYALRALVRNRGFALVAVLSLALGVGANTTIFTLLNAIFFRPMPVSEPASLVAVFATDQRIPGQLGMSYPNYRDFRDHNTVFSSLLLYTPVTTNLTGRGDPQLLMAHLVSGNYFDATGVRPIIGRGFLPEEDSSPGTVPVAVLSHALWLRLYGEDRRVTGSTIQLNGIPHRIVGVTPEGFRGLNQLYGADVFVPLAMYPQIFPLPAMVTSRRSLPFAMAGRLKPGVSLAQAQSGMQSVAQELERQYPFENRGRSVRLVSLNEAALSERMRPVMSRAGSVLMAIAAIVLLIACGNVANLLLARSAGRQREMAVRLAMGAGRSQIVRQLVTESVLLSLIAGACGLLVARWARDLLWAMRPPAFNRAAFRLELDTRVLLFTFAVSLLTGVLFGLAPALRSANPNLATDLRDRGSASGGLGRIWQMRSLLVILQVAFSLVALTGAGLFARSLLNASRIDTGFDTPHLGIVAFNVNDQGYNEARGRDYMQRALERASAVPGVEAAAISHDLPFHVSTIRQVQVAGQENRPTLASIVQPGYFQTMRIPLLRGRDFAMQETKTAPHTVIVNEAAAAAFWPNQDAVGKALTMANEKEPLQVVGVARNANYRELGESPKPLIYFSILQYYYPTAVLYFRTAGDPANVVPAVKREMQLLDRNFLLQAETLDVTMRELLWVQRLSAGLLAVFGTLALVLSTIGIYGVIAYSVRQRTREIGLRIALGASLGEVQTQILREGMRLVMIGVAVGAVISLMAADSVSGLLFLRSPRDWFTFTLVPSILGLVGVVACWIPAMRAARVDPAVALRDE